MTDNNQLNLQPGPAPDLPRPNSHDMLVSMTSGAAKAVPIQNIDRELQRLWKSAASGEHNIARACVLNLLIYTRNPEEAARLSEIAGQLMQRHPNRTILLEAGPPDVQGEQNNLEAYVSIFCQRPRPDAPVVCCEQVTIHASGQSIEQIPSTVLTLLVSDVPVFLWWPGDPPFGQSLYRGLVSAADHLLVDSAYFSQPMTNVTQLAARTQRKYALSDLNWARLTHWRALTAQFFDGTIALEHLARLNKVEIRYGRAKEPNPIQAILLLGWLASRLGWRPGKNAGTANMANQSLHMRGPNGQNIMITLRMVDPLDDTPGSLTGLLLATPDAEFQIMQSAGESGATITTGIKGLQPVQRVVPLRTLTEAELLDQQLEVRGRDNIYEEALTLGTQLVTL